MQVVGRTAVLRGGYGARALQIPNVLARQFTVADVNRVWAADLRYVPTQQRWLYLAVLLDTGVAARGEWAMSGRPEPL